VSDICLVYLPYGPLERPSLAFGLFKVALREAGLEPRVLYPSFRFAERIGTRMYSDLGWVREEMIGEWTFAGAAFPDFRPDHDAYLERVAATYAPEQGASLREALWSVRLQAEAFIEALAREVAALRPRIVACSSTFNQHCAVLAFTRRLKALAPDVTTVVGGANCEGEMGQATAACFPWIDYVVSGEGDELIVPLFRRILERGREGLPYGVLAGGQRHDEQPAPRAMVRNLDACPVPDFDEYFEALEGHSGRALVTPGLVAETSRGCWWGAIKHCTFCGLNGSGMNFRAKSAARAIEEIRALAARYSVPRFLMVDNIMAVSYFREVLPALGGLDLTLFYEIKANVSREQLEALKAAGATWLQPGIESLHDEALALMEKGTSAWINVQLLKWARELGLHLSWNILCGFPGEEDSWFAEMAEMLPLLHHLQPSKEVRRVRFDRFSPHHSRSTDFGLRLRPGWPYRYIYPVDESELARLVYLFEAEGEPTPQTNPLRIRADGPAASLGGPGRDLLQTRMREWYRAHTDVLPPLLSMVEEADRTRIIDTRSVAPAGRVELTGALHEVHRALAGFRTPASLRQVVDLEPRAIEAAVDELVERKLVIRLGSRVMALALAGDVPPLPRRNEDGYPGGWIERRRRRAVGRL
jgi:magnesium-protoporphyrin IX monomethyl ester (oxidative) cyclase